MTKVSVSLFIRRLTPDRSYSKIAAFMIIFMATYSNVCWWFILTQCHPFKYIWNKSGEGTCLDPSISIFMAYMHSGNVYSLTPNQKTATNRPSWCSGKYYHGFLAPGHSDSNDVECEDGFSEEVGDLWCFRPGYTVTNPDVQD